MTSKPKVMLTTVDNPWSPFTHFDEWYVYDLMKGYNTLGFLARIVKTSVNLSQQDQSQDIERAIDEIVKYNVTGRFKKAIQYEDGTEE